MSEEAYVIKLCLLGEGAVGKTSLVYRFVSNRFKKNLASTLGVNISKKEFYIDGDTHIRTLIWDLGGDQKFRMMRKTFLAGAKGALLVFDLTRARTLDKVENWRENFIKEIGEQPMILIGNKTDLVNEIEISPDTAEAYAKAHNMKLILTSAKTGDNVEESFKQMVIEIIKESEN
ncbi:MAG: Rab family GTPase [Promethearchaeota archaeon]